MIRFRAMVPEDAEGVEAVERASFSVPWSRKAFWEEAANECAYYIVALDGERVVGYAGMWIVLDEAQITNVAVEPGRREQGVGSRLMEELIREAKERGAMRMTLEVRPSNGAALALYGKYGFESAGRRPRYYLDNGEDAIIMWKFKI